MSRFEEALSWLAGLTNYEAMLRPAYGRRAMNLPRTRALIDALGSPERRYPILQVAGTKGKGTAAHAAAAMLSAAGYRVGLFTSPHLFDLRERIRIDDRWIGTEEFARGIEALRAHVEPLRGTDRCPTFFELITALALLHFAEERVDAAVLEVGLGGRLDATSAVRPLASLITQIGLDHTAVLGPTKALIAVEKAGVAKRGVPLVSGVPPGSRAGRAIAGEAGRRGALLRTIGRDFRIRTGRPRFENGCAGTALTLRESSGRIFRARSAVLSRDLARDAALAAALLLTPEVAERLPANRADLAAGLDRFAVPGRVQVVSERPYVVVDGAHNPDSARSLVRAIREALPREHTVAVVGGGADKMLAEVVSALTALGPDIRFVFTAPASHPRAADPRKLAEDRDGAEWRTSLPAALRRARRLATPEDLVLIAGSMYLAGEACGILERL